MDVCIGELYPWGTSSAVFEMKYERTFPALGVLERIHRSLKQSIEIRIRLQLLSPYLRPFLQMILSLRGCALVRRFKSTRNKSIWGIPAGFGKPRRDLRGCALVRRLQLQQKRESGAFPMDSGNPG
jgi:hypothetical protein